MDNTERAALRALLEAATPGPWTRTKPPKDAEGWQRGVIVAATYGRQPIYATPPGGQFPSADADLIAALRNAAPALLDDVERLERERDALRKALRRIDDAEQAHCAAMNTPREQAAYDAVGAEIANARALLPAGEAGK